MKQVPMGVAGISSQSYESDSDEMAFLGEDGAYNPAMDDSLYSSKTAYKRPKKKKRRTAPQLSWEKDFTVSIGEMPMLLRNAYTHSLEKPARVFLRRNVARGLAFWSALLLPRHPKDVLRVWAARPGGVNVPLPVRMRGVTTHRRQGVEELVEAEKQRLAMPPPTPN